jgi:hypothetical protein
MESKEVNDRLSLDLLGGGESSCWVASSYENPQAGQEELPPGMLCWHRGQFIWGAGLYHYNEDQGHTFKSVKMPASPKM